MCLPPLSVVDGGSVACATLKFIIATEISIYLIRSNLLITPLSPLSHVAHTPAQGQKLINWALTSLFQQKEEEIPEVSSQRQ